MDERAAKLALARKKLKDHQDKKHHQDNNIQNSDVEINREHKNGVIEQHDSGNVAGAIYMQIDTNRYSTEIKQEGYTSANKPEVNATEILISSKIKLEQQITDLKAKNAEQEKKLLEASVQFENLCQKVNTLENELRNVHMNYNNVIEKLEIKDALIKELNNSKAVSVDEKNNLHEQLEFTKTILAAKETENDSLHTQLFNIQSLLDTTQLQLQQLTSGAHDPNKRLNQESLRHENELLTHKVSTLEQQLKSQLKDYQQTNSHFEHYVGELNEQLKTVTRKNEDMHRDLQNLSNRENDLIEQISEMEIRLQNYNRTTVEENTSSQTENTFTMQEFNELLSKYNEIQENLQQTREKYEELHKLYTESTTKIDELSRAKEYEIKQNNEASLLKLNADITSDKLAAQRATEQNKKMKYDLLGLEETVAKMTQDKLELTEKITAEKFLNRELTIKLAEIDEKSNNLQTTLKAKDEEMIRLQATYRHLEEAYEDLKHTRNTELNSECLNNNNSEIKQEVCGDEIAEIKHNYKSVECAIEHSNDKEYIPKGDAMLKLQERFLKIMEDVADLSDEKHRLEHIIMQLQNETDTICEYVALYQQQRSLLKKRDEERSAQIKMFQTECNRLQNQLDELTGILKRFSEDNDLSSYFKTQAKYDDIQQVMSILSNLKTSSFLDLSKTIEFRDNFYPCSCCSGKLIDV